jgi:NAD(P) transhydrogenase subunit alpha
MSVIVEAGAGHGACFTDDAYRDAGATVGPRREVIGGADVLVTVTSPQPDDLPHIREGQVVIGMLAPLTDPDLTDQLARRGAIAISLDCIPRTVSRAQAMDVLTSQANVAGYKAVLVAANAFGRYFPMLITAAGTSRPASVLVLGAGVAGLSAIGTARRLGAVVTGYDVRPETRAEVESLGAKYLMLGAVEGGSGTGGYARALSTDEQQAQQDALESRMASFDVVITTAQVPGRRPPLLVTAGALHQMRPGTVVVDLAASGLGGNVEGSVPGEDTVTDRGVTVIGAGDLASRVPMAASDAFSHNVGAVLGLIVRDGELVFDMTDEVQAAIVVTRPDATALAGPEEEQCDERVPAL